MIIRKIFNDVFYHFNEPIRQMPDSDNDPSVTKMFLDFPARRKWIHLHRLCVLIPVNLRFRIDHFPLAMMFIEHGVIRLKIMWWKGIHITYERFWRIQFHIFNFHPGYSDVFHIFFIPFFIPRCKGHPIPSSRKKL